MAVVCAFGPTEVQIATLGALVSILAGLLRGFLEQEHQRYRRQTELLRQLSVPVGGRMASLVERLGQEALT
jgi:hypothetical protein